MKRVIHKSDGSIVAVHHRHSEDPIADGLQMLEVEDGDWPDDFDIDSWKVQDGSLVQP